VVIEAEDDSAKAKVAEVIEEENSEIGVRVRTMKASKTKGKKKKWEQRTRELKGRMRMKGGGQFDQNAEAVEESSETTDDQAR
jgi:hypothetical protein